MTDETTLLYEGVIHEQKPSFSTECKIHATLAYISEWERRAKLFIKNASSHL